jgi:hypothetical protein
LCHQVGVAESCSAGVFVVLGVFHERVKCHAHAADESGPAVAELTFEEELLRKDKRWIENECPGGSAFTSFESAERDFVCPVVELF